MKITINIPSAHVATLRRWASVSRTLSKAAEICNDLSASPYFDDDEREQASHTADEVAELEPVLDSLHQTVRNAIWKLMPHDKETVKGEQA